MTPSQDNYGFDEHLQRIHAAGEEAIALALQDHRANLGVVHQLDLDVGAWASRATGPYSDQLRAARRELGIAEYCVATGTYRQAYASLRLFLELSFAAVHFSVNEFERRRWVSDRQDFSWSAAIGRDEGLLSARFVQEFAPSLVGAAVGYAALAQEAYRHCSQFVHGKLRVSQALPEEVRYSSTVVHDWCSTAKNCAEAVLFLLYVRFGDDHDVEADVELQDTLISHFGHIEAVRKRLGLSEDV